MVDVFLISISSYTDKFLLIFLSFPDVILMALENSESICLVRKYRLYGPLIFDYNCPTTKVTFLCLVVDPLDVKNKYGETIIKHVDR